MVSIFTHRELSRLFNQKNDLKILLSHFEFEVVLLLLENADPLMILGNDRLQGGCQNAKQSVGQFDPRASQAGSAIRPVVLAISAAKKGRDKLERARRKFDCEPPPLRPNPARKSAAARLIAPRGCAPLIKGEKGAHGAEFHEFRRWPAGMWMRG